MNIDNYIDLNLPREYGLNLDHFLNTPLTKHSLYSIEAEVIRLLNIKYQLVKFMKCQQFLYLNLIVK